MPDHVSQVNLRTKLRTLPELAPFAAWVMEVIFGHTIRDAAGRTEVVPGLVESPSAMLLDNWTRVTRPELRRALLGGEAEEETARPLCKDLLGDCDNRMKNK